MTTNPAGPRPAAASNASDASIPDLSRSGSSVMDVTTWRLNKLKCRLEDEEATMHKQLRHFYDIKHAISRICQNDEAYLDNPDIIKANTVLEDRVPPNPERKCCGARDALALLKAGNAQFLRDEVVPKSSSDRHVALHFGQKPYAVVIACSDSRVPPEMIFNQGFGDLFVIRLAGNTVDALARASLLYAVLNLEAPLVVVLGHESCGAVTAALAPEEKTKAVPGDIKALIQNIKKGLHKDTLTNDATDEERLMCAIVGNVFHVVHSLEGHPDIAPLIEAGKLAVVGAYYGFHGVVSFFDNEEEGYLSPLVHTPRSSSQNLAAAVAAAAKAAPGGGLCASCGNGHHNGHAPVLDGSTHATAAPPAAPVGEDTEGR